METFVWEVDESRYRQIRQIFFDLEILDPAEDQEEVETLKDRLRSIPGYPVAARENDHVRIVLRPSPRVIMHS